MKETNNNAIKRAILELDKSDKYEITLTQFENMECYLVNGVISIVPILRKYKNLETGETFEIDPYTAKAEVQKIIRKAILEAKEFYKSNHQQTIL